MLNSKEFVRELQLRHESAWMNPNVGSADAALAALPLTRTDVDDAEARLERFAPFIKKVFPETAADRGLIESPLTEIENMRAWLNENEGAQLAGKLFLKRDSDLPVAGSVKARGGCYAVLKHTEDLALANRLVEMRDDYSVFATRAFRNFFSQYELHVGSTGNLGLSIGIMGAALGYRVTVHMSADARQWKKNLLRKKGVTVLEYGADYSYAVQKGRERAAEDPRSYFIDDENSVDLFLGYAVAARRLKAQLAEQNIAVDDEHPLLVYIPCGVGGAPGGICFGLKQEFGDVAHVYFAEPVEAPCMLLGLASGLQNEICVQDIGLTGRTAADGLAVSRPSGFVGETVKAIVSGGFTVSDERLFADLHALYETEGLFVEPSACAGFAGAVELSKMTDYLESSGLVKSQAKNAVLFQQTILRYFVHFGQHEKATRQSPAGSLCFIVLFPCYFRVLCVRFSLKYERAGAARPPPPSTRPAPCSHSARLKPFAGSCSSRFGFA